MLFLVDVYNPICSAYIACMHNIRHCYRPYNPCRFIKWRERRLKLILENSRGVADITCRLFTFCSAVLSTRGNGVPCWLSLLFASSLYWLLLGGGGPVMRTTLCGSLYQNSHLRPSIHSRSCFSSAVKTDVEASGFVTQQGDSSTDETKGICWGIGKKEAKLVWMKVTNIACKQDNLSQVSSISYTRCVSCSSIRQRNWTFNKWWSE